MEQTIQTNIKGKNLRSSRSQMFFKIAVLRNFAELSRKCLRCSLYLIKLKAWRLAFLLKKAPRQVFSCEYFEIFKSCFFYRTPPVHYTFPKFYVMIWFFRLHWVQYWHFLYFLNHCFVVHHNSIRISIPWLFRTCFYTKISNKSNFRMYYSVGSPIKISCSPHLGDVDTSWNYLKNPDTKSGSFLSGLCNSSQFILYVSKIIFFKSTVLLNPSS